RSPQKRLRSVLMESTPVGYSEQRYASYASPSRRATSKSVILPAIILVDDPEPLKTGREQQPSRFVRSGTWAIDCGRAFNLRPFQGGAPSLRGNLRCRRQHVRPTTRRAGWGWLKRGDGDKDDHTRDDHDCDDRSVACSVLRIDKRDYTGGNPEHPDRRNRDTTQRSE